MNCEYDIDSVVGVILPVENKILPIVHFISKLTNHTHFLTLFDKNIVAVCLLVVKMAVSQIILCLKC